MSEELPKNEIIQGDCIEVMKEFPENSIDSVVTDPPYGLSYMGRNWDEFNPKSYQNFCEEWGKEIYRVLKPGSFVLSFSGTRTYHRMATGLEDAGFEIKNMINWVFLNGFPKATDLSKLIDKKFGKEDERKIIGEKEHRGNIGYESETYDYKDKVRYITEPATEEGKEWQGWKTALKPSHEPIVLARKTPDDKTYADCALEYGVGGLNIDDTRIGKEERYPSNMIISEDVEEEYEDLSKTYFKTPKAGMRERHAGLEDEENDIVSLKPINLMRYLCRLITPPDGIVLDPFAGACTTGCACGVEELNYIMIEKREKFAKEVGPNRVEYWSKPENWTDLNEHPNLPNLKQKKAKKQNKSLFDF